MRRRDRPVARGWVAGSNSAVPRIDGIKLIFTSCKALNWSWLIKLIRDGLLSLCCTTGLFNYLYLKFQSLRDDHLSLGCTCPKVPCLCKIFSRITYSFGPKVPCLCPNILQSPVKLDPQEYVFFAFLSSVRPISFPSLEHVPRLHRSRSPRPSHHLVSLPARSSKTIYRIPNLYKQFWTKLWEKIMKKKLWIDRFRKHLD